MYGRSTINVILFVAGLGACAAALAGGRVFSAPLPPVIVKATFDATENVLIISGRNFGEGPPTVLLAEEALEVKRFSPHEVIATLPRGLAHASYGIAVITNNPRSRAASSPFSVTLPGAGGPGSPSATNITPPKTRVVK